MNTKKYIGKITKNMYYNIQRKGIYQQHKKFADIGIVILEYNNKE